MCGIFGFTTKEKSGYSEKEIKKILRLLFKLSESRGREAAGLAVKTGSRIDILKSPLSASDFLKSDSYKKFIDKFLGSASGQDGYITIIGHSRLATHGSEYQDENNQPVIKDKAVCVHNGIIANDKELWREFLELKKESEVDTEVFLSLLQLFLSKTGSMSLAVKKVFDIIEGSASVAVLFDNNRNLILATNTGSLYICVNKINDAFVFASERYILEQFIDKIGRIDQFSKEDISQVMPGTALAFNTATLEKMAINFKNIKDKLTEIPLEKHPETKIINHSAGQYVQHSSSANKNYIISPELKREMQETWERIYVGEGLKRCTNCLYPETMPFIEFDEKGACNYCRNHKKFEVKGHDELEKIVFKYRRADGKPDCIVPFSGGRDSSYGLHYIKKVLKMNPIAYTYDWGVMTDLGRRNEARVCGKLGVEHIIISADIRKKRRNIRKNIEAWLKKSELGMVPLFMAGDKQLLYYTQWLGEKTNTNLAIYSAGRWMENEPFKIGFCGVRVNSILPLNLDLPLIDRIRAAKYYTSQYILNPSYINRSLLDTIFSFYSMFIFSEKIRVELFDYIRWEEKEILKTIIDEYGWEVEKDTNATWRIDDGTAPFYNYIYMTVAGFTEFDTFRSAQIREGQLDRETAYRLIKEENKPRFDSLEWYARTIGFDINYAIKRINSTPKLYKL